jgi:hypothetical protein
LGESPEERGAAAALACATRHGNGGEGGRAMGGSPADRIPGLLASGPSDTLRPLEERWCAGTPGGSGRKRKGEGVAPPLRPRRGGRGNAGAESSRLGTADRLPDGRLFAAGGCVQLVRGWRFLDTAPAVFATAFAAALAGVRLARRVARDVGHRRAASLHTIARRRVAGRSGKRHGDGYQESHGAKPRLSGGSVHGSLAPCRAFALDSNSMTRGLFRLAIRLMGPIGLMGPLDPSAAWGTGRIGREKGEAPAESPMKRRQ